MPIKDMIKSIPDILNNYHHIAIVGLSASPWKPSYGVAKYLLNAGYNIYPVNPNYDTVLNLKCYPTLETVPFPIDIVNIFRKTDKVLSIVQDAILINAKVVWMQQGIIHDKAADLALKAGLEVVMDRCIKIDHLHYFG